MVAYQKYGVVTVSVIFIIIQTLKLQNIRLSVAYEECLSSNPCMNFSALWNNTNGIFEDENLRTFMYKILLISNFVAILPCIILAAWSDKHGRKLLLILPCVGSFISDIFMLILIFVPSATSDILFISEGIYGFFGGSVLMSIGCMCYITDSTDHRQRTLSISVYVGFLNLVIAIDALLQFFWTPLKIHFSFHTLVMMGAIIRMVFSVLFIIYLKIFVAESVFILGSYHGNPWVNLLTPINVADTVSCVFKRRMDSMRIFIIALNVVFIFYSIVLYGNMIALPQYFRNEVHWSYMELTIWTSIYLACQSAVLWISVYFAYKWKALDSNLGTCGSISLGLYCLILTLAKQHFVLVAGMLAGIVSLLLPASVISMLSKLIERIETGSMFAGIGFMMLLTQVIAVPLYRVLIQTCKEAGVPQVVFLLSFGFATFSSLFFIYLRRTIAPDLLGHLDGSESLALINRKGRIESLF